MYGHKFPRSINIPAEVAVFAALVLSLTSCASPTLTPTSEAGPATLQSSPLAPPQTPQPGTLTAPDVTGTQSPAVPLQILTPHDGEAVNAQQIQVTGMTVPGAVVSINDDVLIADGDGRFQANVALNEGPNLIEVIASDAAGNESSVELGVTYEP